jgi:hypothetical protein
MPVPTVNPILIEALSKCLENLEEQIGELHSLTVSTERNEEWDRVRNAVSCLDSVADVMRQALDAIQEAQAAKSRRLEPLWNPGGFCDFVSGCKLLIYMVRPARLELAAF